MLTHERLWRGLLAASAVLLLGVILYRLVPGSPATPGAPLSVPDYVSGWEGLLDTQGGQSGGKAVQIVEFIDIQCPACAAQHSAIKAVRERIGDKVAVKFVHFPLSIHPFAVAAARRMECARQQGREFEFLDAAYERQTQVEAGEFEEIRRAAGVADSLRFALCATDEASAKPVEAGRNAGVSAGVFATPTTIVSGWRFRGVIPVEDFIDLVERLLRKELPAGVQTVLANSPSSSRQGPGRVRIAEYDKESVRSAPQHVLSSTPLAVVGGRDGEPRFDLTFMEDAHVLGDGRLVTFSPRGGTLLLFGADGKPEKDLSAPGSGPREWRGAHNIARAFGDTLVLLDPANRRVNWLTSRDGIVRSTRLADAAPSDLLKVAGQLSDGSLVVHSSGRVNLATVAASGNNSVQHTLADVAVLSAESITRLESVRDLRVAPLKTPGSAKAVYEVELLSSAAHVLVWDSLVVAATSDSIHLQLRNSVGELVGIIRVRSESRRTTPEMRRTEINRLFEYLEFTSESDRAFRVGQQSLEMAPVAEFLPAFDRLLLSPDKTLWVTELGTSGQAAWTATGFRLDGTIVGHLTGTRSGLPVAFGKDRVFVRTVDEDGVVALRAYRLQRAAM